jgi:hypothetical protein
MTVHTSNALKHMKQAQPIAIITKIAPAVFCLHCGLLPLVRLVQDEICEKLAKEELARRAYRA